MENTSSDRPERSSLLDRRDTLLIYLGTLRAEESRACLDLDNIDAALLAFRQKQPLRDAEGRRQPNGEAVRTVLRILRAADQPLTTAEITTEVRRLLPPAFAPTERLRKQVGARLWKLDRAKLVRSVGCRGSAKLWELAR